MFHTCYQSRVAAAAAEPGPVAVIVSDRRGRLECTVGILWAAAAAMRTLLIEVY